MSTEKKPLKAILVDDDSEQAYLLARLVARIDSFDVDLVHYSTSDKAMARLLAQQCDLVILDHHLQEERTGLDLLRSLRDIGFDGPIVMLTGSDDDKLIDDFLRFGADAYVHKNDLVPERIHEAIQVALKLPHQLVPRVITEKGPRS